MIFRRTEPVIDFQDFRKSFKLSGGINRRLWMAYCSSLASLPLLAQKSEARIVSHPKFSDNPFALGVA
ncbi:MAG: hypothetical protein RJA81_650, partial [Planctomycetota bacterium]